MVLYYIVLDFEATCTEANEKSFQKEIIEFPMVVVEASTCQIVDVFESFVKPTIHPTLTQFCTQLTSIKQCDVDHAEPFQEVMKRAMHFVEEYTVKGNVCFVTCGEWDLKTMLPRELARTQFETNVCKVPNMWRRYINIKRLFHKVFGKSLGMDGMLSYLGLELDGHHHRGIDDCRNIVKILTKMIDKLPLDS